MTSSSATKDKENRNKPMTTFGKLTRFNFSKQKYNTTPIFFFAIYNSIISKYSKSRELKWEAEVTQR